MTSCFQKLQTHSTTLSNVDNFALQFFLFANFKFLNLTGDLKVGVPRIGSSHEELLFKIGFLQLQLKSLKNSSERVHFLVKLQIVGLLILPRKFFLDLTKNEFRHRFFSRILTASVKHLHYRIAVCWTPIFIEHLSMAAYKESNIWKCTCMHYLYSLHSNV